MKPIIKSLPTRLILAFLGLSFVTVLIVAYMSYDRAKAALKGAVYDRLTATLELKEDALNNWIHEKTDNLLLIRDMSEIHQKLLRILKSPPGELSDDFFEIYNLFFTLGMEHPDFDEIFLLSRRGGEILVSSSLDNQGNFRVTDTYFIEGLKGLFLQDIYLSPVTFKPTITIAVPIQEGNERPAGVLAIHLDLARLDRIIFERSGLGKTGESYLVDATNTFVSAREFGRTEYPRGAHSEGIKRALEDRSMGTGLYRNYAGVNVVGSYKWIPERGMALLAEIPQKEAFYPARRLAQQILVIGLLVSLFLTLATRWVAKRISRPILAVKDAADRISKGDRVVRAPVATADEVGALAKAFNRMVDQIQESEERFRTIFDTIPDSVIILRLSDAKIVGINRGFLDATGYALDDILGKTTLQIGIWDDLRDRERFYSILKKESRVRNLEISLVMKDGSTRVELLSADVITLEGEPHLLAISRDISKLKGAEEAARQSEERFRSTFEQAAVGMAQVGLDGQWLRINKRLCEILGYDREELLEMTFQDITHPDDLEEDLDYVGQVLRGEISTYSMEKRYIRKDGSVVWGHLTVALVRHEDGTPGHFISVVQDISDRKEAERALRESEERLRVLFNSGSDPILVFGIGQDWLPGEFFAVNDMACRLLGRSSGELEEMTFLDIQAESQGPGEMRRLISNILEKGQFTFHQRVINREGDKIPVEISASLFQLQEKSSVLVVLRDLTDRIKADEERKKIQAKLIQTNKMTSLGLMVSSLAHEINNPNNTIMFNLRRFAKTWEDVHPILEEHYRKHGDFYLGGVPFSELTGFFPRLISGTLESSEMIKVIIQNLRGFVRQSSDNMDFDVDVNEVVRNSLALLETQITKNLGSLEVKLQPDIPLIKGNPQKLVQVAVNLISNALEALTGESQAVRVSTLANGDGSEVTMVISDNGIGMNQNQLANVFEPFFSTKLELGGTGLGLPITRMLLDEHGALLDIRSAPGEGTEVKVTLYPEGRMRERDKRFH